jgi:hypothetical protein
LRAFLYGLKVYVHGFVKRHTPSGNRVYIFGPSFVKDLEFKRRFAGNTFYNSVGMEEYLDALASHLP